MQRVLSDKQLEEFYHDNFVDEQIHDFLQLVGPSPSPKGGVVVDMGGGVGFFARRLAAVATWPVRVVDADGKSVEACGRAGVPAVVGDALAPTVVGDEDTVCFNLILHHLVGGSEPNTRRLQSRALAVWLRKARRVFVNEYIYDSYFGTFSGWLIFQITNSRLLSTLARIVGRVVPGLRANTLGVGVRFRAHDEWVRLFREAGYDVKSSTRGDEEPVFPPLRLLAIKSIRRDSFLLEAASEN